MTTVGFQGIRGAFSEAAIYRHFGESVSTKGFDDFEQVFDAVVNGDTEFGVIAVENSIAGSVSQNYDFFLQKPVVAIAEIYLPIRHFLLASRGVQLRDISAVLSHPMALKQCDKFLREHQLRQIPEYDTAGAAQIIAEDRSPDHGAIASELAARYYDLNILAGDIQTNQVNMTRFLVISTEPDENQVPEKTSIAFKTHHHPGALEECLHQLTKNSINLTKIQSRPIPENPWEYVFYADFEGGTQESHVTKALDDLRETARYLLLIGSYPKGKRE